MFIVRVFSKREFRKYFSQFRWFFGQKYTIKSILEIKNILSLEFQATNLNKLTKKFARLSFGIKPRITLMNFTYFSFNTKYLASHSSKISILWQNFSKISILYKHVVLFILFYHLLMSPLLSFQVRTYLGDT